MSGSNVSTLAKNSVFNVAYKLLNVLFPLIFSAYVARVLLAEGVGRVSYAQNIVQYFTIVAALGLPNYGTREIAKIRGRKTQLNQLFTELFSINALSTTVCVVAYYTLILCSSYFASDRLLYAVLGLNVLLNYLNVDWFYQGMEQYAYIAVRSFIIKLISLAAIFLFVRDESDYVIYGLIFSLALAGNYVLNIANLKKYDVRFDLSGLDIKRHVKPVAYLLCTAIVIELYTLLDTTMLGIMCPKEIVGYYTNSMRLVKVLITVITAMGGVLLPRLSVYRSQGDYEKCSEIVNKIFSIMLYLFLPCGIGIFLVADSIILVLFGADFQPAIQTIKIASLLIYALGFSNLFGTQVLLTYGCEKKLLLCTAIGAVINISMNLVLIPLYAQNGATVASVISETIVTVLTFAFARKYIHFNISKSFLISSIIGTGVMSIAVMGVKTVVHNELLSLCAAASLGAALYVVVTWVMKNDVLQELVTKCGSKVRRRNC